MFPLLEIRLGGASFAFWTQSFLLIAVILSVVTAYWILFRKILHPFKLGAILFFTIAFALIGGRLFHVLFERYDHFSVHPDEILTRWDGMTFYGELILGGLVYFSLVRLLVSRGETRARLHDAAGIGTAFCYAVLKLGCLAGGCCWGKLCAYPWAIQFTDPRSVMPALGIPVHPVQIYEATFSALLGFVLLILARTGSPHGRFRGMIFWYFCLGYAPMRFATEFFRGDRFRGEDLLFGLSMSQLLSLVVFALGMGVVLARRRATLPLTVTALGVSTILLLPGCALPSPPDRRVILKSEVIGEGLEWNAMKPVYRQSPSGKPTLPHLRKKIARGRNLLFAALDNRIQTELETRTSDIFGFEGRPPRVEDVSWWHLAPRLRWIYDEVLRIPHDRLTRSALLQALQVMESRGKPYDVFILTHGLPNHLILNGGTFSFRDVATLKGRLAHARVIYLQACWGSSLAQDWLDTGAQVVMSYPGEYRNFFFPDFFFYYLKRYKGGHVRAAFEMARWNMASSLSRSGFHSRIIEQVMGMSIDEYMELSPPPAWLSR